MRVKTYGVLSYVMLGLGGLSIVGALALYAAGMQHRKHRLRKDDERPKSGENEEQLEFPQSPRPLQYVHR